MAAIDDLKSALADLHQTIADNIASQEAVLIKIADANAANDQGKIAELLRQARQDNTDLLAETEKSKAALAPPAAT